MRLSVLAILSAATAIPVMAQGHDRDHDGHGRPGTVIEQRDQGRGHDREVVVEERRPGREVVVEKDRPGREVVVERRAPARTVVVERQAPGRTVVVERREPVRVVHYGYHDSPREWRRVHAHEYAAHAYYSDRDRVVLERYTRRIPPGHLRRMHPEWRDRIIVGEPVPADVVVEPVPIAVERQLPPLPKNYVRFQVGSSFFIKDVHTNIVIDALF